ncbi:hypothetical protein BJ138DRAFT_1228682 [Hygrophoropsis aurantiaca]|uniref:Uncharacterized protein n=1 Tax=Hygrophoropsis aurantiaca TaxID=72124 RepID=A0ACB8AHN2_9AGAM|nr:hypothetical protein BJ138DRAFT_1228682 [Hygrophoropsis aurantiaca]
MDSHHIITTPGHPHQPPTPPDQAPDAHVAACVWAHYVDCGDRSERSRRKPRNNPATRTYKHRPNPHRPTANRPPITPKRRRRRQNRALVPSRVSLRDPSAGPQIPTSPPTTSNCTPDNIEMHPRQHRDAPPTPSRCTPLRGHDAGHHAPGHPNPRSPAGRLDQVRLAFKLHTSRLPTGISETLMLMLASLLATGSLDGPH